MNCIILESEDLDEEEVDWTNKNSGYRQFHLPSPTRWLGIYKLCDSFISLESKLLNFKKLGVQFISISLFL